MTIDNAKYFSKELQLSRPINTSKSIIKTRRIFVLQLTDSEGNIYSGEASPLPDFGSETYEEAESSLNQLTQEFEKQNAPLNFHDIEYFLNQYSLSPTVKSALEQCLVELCIKTGNNPGFPNRSTIKSNGLISISTLDETFTNINKLLTSGFTTIKIKVGLNDINSELDIIKAISVRYPKIILRLDVNGAWAISEAVGYIARLKDSNIEFIEQPTKSFEDLIKLSETSPIPIGADESVRSISDAEFLINNTSIPVLVIKPHFIGGIIATRKVINLANSLERKVVISSALESNLGRRALILATVFASKETAHGVSTSNLFENDLYTNYFPISNGMVNYDLTQFLDK